MLNQPFMQNKGIPIAARLPASLLDSVSLPALVLHEAALNHNIAWMQRFADAHHAQLAPHGKTTMTPALFQRQLAAGAWGITLATAPQCLAAYAGGMRRLLLANQLVGRANMSLIADLLRERTVDFYCLVDSADNVRALGQFFAAQRLKLQVLVELGVPGGRCGCRTPEQTRALAEAVAAEPALVLAGIEGYEGIIHGGGAEDDVRSYAETLVTTALEFATAGRFAVDRPVLTASGSKWYDVIAAAFDRPELRARCIPVLRPGCYIVHDHGIYARAQQAIRARHPDIGAGLRPAAEVFAQIQSIPEPGRAVAAMGRRDAAFDADLPLPLRIYRGGGNLDPETPAGWSVTRLMDQHAFLDIPKDANVRIGDTVAFGISHPCTTFDKWRQVCLVDEALNVIEVMPTQF
jgi:D-serine deaminase-like pyridoxal phosphate-dependent protein